MNKNIIKKLVEITISNKDVSEITKNFIFNKFSKSDLKTYNFYLKKAIKKNKVILRMPNDLNQSILVRVLKIFPNKEIIYERDLSLIAGLQLEYDDNIINLNMNYWIKKMFSTIKGEI